jgi:hypothetical protein
MAYSTAIIEDQMDSEPFELGRIPLAAIGSTKDPSFSLRLLPFVFVTVPALKGSYRLSLLDVKGTSTSVCGRRGNAPLQPGGEDALDMEPSTLRSRKLEQSDQFHLVIAKNQLYRL